MSKKTKKMKGKTVDLGEFLNTEGEPVQAGFTVMQKKIDWTDENGMYQDLSPIILPTAPMSSRGCIYDDAKVPTEAPFTAHLGNLPFEVDEEDIANFFSNLKVKSVRLPRDTSQRPKGFGYVEFQDRATLIEALNMDGEQMKSRSLKIGLPGTDAADGKGNLSRDRQRGGFGGAREGERDLPTDWRAAAREEQQTSRYDNYSRPGDRFGDRSGGGGGFGDRSGGGFGDRDTGRDWRDRGGDRDNRGFSSRYEPARDRDSRNDENSSAPAERPKLKLNPRTVPIEPIQVAPQEEAKEEKKEEKPRPKIEKPKATDIFGAAKPVDTASKEREIEKRLEAARRENQDDADQQQQQTQQPNDATKSAAENPKRQNKPVESAGGGRSWREESREEREKKEKKVRSERRAPAIIQEDKPLVVNSKNKFADLDNAEADAADSDGEEASEN